MQTAVETLAIVGCCGNTVGRLFDYGNIRSRTHLLAVVKGFAVRLNCCYWHRSQAAWRQTKRNRRSHNDNQGDRLILRWWRQ